MSADRLTNRRRFHAALLFVLELLPARTVVVHPETPDRTLAVSESKRRHFSSWQGNRGAARRRTSVPPRGALRSVIEPATASAATAQDLYAPRGAAVPVPKPQGGKGPFPDGNKLDASPRTRAYTPLRFFPNSVALGKICKCTQINGHLLFLFHKQSISRILKSLKRVFPVRAEALRRSIDSSLPNPAQNHCCALQTVDYIAPIRQAA
jgi:hypothetical protein